MRLKGVEYIQNGVVTESINTLIKVSSSFVDSYITKTPYTKKTVNKLGDELEMAAATCQCRIIILSTDGDILVDTTKTKKDFNLFDGDNSFLTKRYSENCTMNGYLDEPSLVVSAEIEHNPYLNGRVLFAQSNQIIKYKSDYYYNILMMVFYVMFALLGLAFIFVYLFNFRPLKKISKGVSTFSIDKYNTPIKINSNDEYRELADALNLLGLELNKFEDYQRKFISNISHDLRSPITSISGYAQAMKDGVIDIEDQDEYFDIIIQEAERLTKMTTNILEMNTLDKNKIILSPTKYDIVSQINKVTVALKGNASKKNIRFRTDFKGKQKIRVIADEEKIYQVIQNLVDNAIKFSNIDSTIFISVYSKGNKTYVSIKDTGIGIPKNDIQQIWYRFYKTDLSRGKDKMGSGIGLSICKEIIEAHNQTIEVISTEGIGSEFIFSIKRG